MVQIEFKPAQDLVSHSPVLRPSGPIGGWLARNQNSFVVGACRRRKAGSKEGCGESKQEEEEESFVNVVAVK